jgi:hypothetical protein
VQRQVLLRLSHLGVNATRSPARSRCSMRTPSRGSRSRSPASTRREGERAAAALEAAPLLHVGDALRFAHPIPRAAVYQDLPVATRAAEHRRAAEVLREDLGRAAVHLLATLPAGDADVVDRLLIAARRAETACCGARGRTAQAREDAGVALHSGGLVENSIDTLREAADVLATTPWRWEEAETLIDLGAALRRANRRVDAREPLRHGPELAQGVGARATAARAREELTATGSAATPEGSLTVSERRVAQRAAAGATIAEIAEAPMATRSAWTASQAPRPPHTWPFTRPAG